MWRGTTVQDSRTWVEQEVASRSPNRERERERERERGKEKGRVNVLKQLLVMQNKNAFLQQSSGDNFFVCVRLYRVFMPAAQATNYKVLPTHL